MRFAGSVVLKKEKALKMILEGFASNSTYCFVRLRELLSAEQSPPAGAENVMLIDVPLTIPMHLIASQQL